MRKRAVKQRRPPAPIKLEVCALCGELTEPVVYAIGPRIPDVPGGYVLQQAWCSLEHWEATRAQVAAE